ncbi:MAG: hypothetical protein EWV63_14205 [Microcystis aeruginosa Ma_OC_H_19870700_S124]|uniref:Uncharacterized protein n=1 Tax=Microcystis aeruginosa Ma_OC_H_19870700_S124 TaxID=2486262 RepID=A0A552AHL9_MICAE|nr:MAG: hypothetical protein EWV63_14205 [Microcystis aeruginosa Ma_OC_H_19870700_S124]
MASCCSQRSGNRSCEKLIQLSVISYQLSVISYQLSVISYQLSVISEIGKKRLAANSFFIISPAKVSF